MNDFKTCYQVRTVVYEVQGDQVLGKHNVHHMSVMTRQVIGSRTVTIIFVVSVCLSVCAEFFSAVFDPILIKLGHMIHVRV